MPFKTWAVGDVLTASDQNTYVGKQVVAQVTSGTRPSSPPEGQTIYETDTDVYSVYTGAAWLTALSTLWIDFSGSFAWTATTTNPVIGNGTIQAKYQQIGKAVTYRGYILMGSTTTFGSGIYEINWPITPTSAANTNGAYVGAAYILDNSASATWAAVVRSNSTTALRFDVTNAAASGDLNPTNPVTFAQNDRISWCITYEIP